MKTQVFAHRGIVGILSAPDAEGLMNDPSDPNQIGYVVEAKAVEMSIEALSALKDVKKSNDDIGDVDVFWSVTKGAVFGWLGGRMAMIDPSVAEGSSTYDADLLPSSVTIVPNNPPAEFVRVVDKIVNAVKHAKEKKAAKIDIITP